MQVPVITGPGEIAIVDEPDPELLPGYALVEVHACGVCGTELAWFKGHVSRPYPIRRLGHEFSGVVLEVGPNVDRVAPGDHVVSGLVSCGRCFHCRHGHPNYCELQPKPLFSPAGIARHLIVAAGEVSFLTKIDAAVDLLHAALHEPLNCALRIAERSEAQPGDQVAIYGLGPMGLLTALCLKSHGITRIIGIDSNPHRLELARSVGLEQVIDGQRDVAPAILHELTEGYGVDVAIEATGNPEVFKTCVDVVRVGGRIVQAGLAHTSLENFPHSSFIHKEIEVVGAKGTYPSYLPNGKQRSVDLLERGVIPVEKLIRCYPIGETLQAFADMAAGRVLKPVIVPQR